MVVDENVWKYHAEGCLSSLEKSDVIILPIAEEQKCLDSVLGLYEKMIERSAKRNMTIVTIGGGIAQDITGFMASTLYRGINWIFIPTTLLAQADSCIGSKTSLNYKDYKNLIGTFYPPSKIYIYPPFLETQNDYDYFSGLGEVAKLYLMGGESKICQLIDKLPSLISKDTDTLLTVVQDCLLIKKSFIEGDEFDAGRRNLLNFGHCFGHAIESATDFAIPHGQAVALGMLLANSVSKNRGLLSPEQESFLAESLLWPVIKIPPDALNFDNVRVAEAMKKDKKRTGSKLALVMITDNYQVIKVDDLSKEEAINSLNQLRVSCNV